MRVPSLNVCVTVVVASAENGAPLTTGPARGSASLRSIGTRSPAAVVPGPPPRRPWPSAVCPARNTSDANAITHTAGRPDLMAAPVAAYPEPYERTAPLARDRRRRQVRLQPQ